MANPEESYNISITIKDLLEAGAHFGHQKRRWNPKMKRFILEERNGIYIIDLAKTMALLRVAIRAVQETVARRRTVLFVGTKQSAKSVIQECATDCGEFYVAERWLGGTLTNLTTIRQSVKRLVNTEKLLATGGAGLGGAGGGLTKKELSQLAKQQAKLNRNLGGVRQMSKLPGLVIVVDLSLEHIAVEEAKKLNIPILGLTDTNANPDGIAYVVPCNDDAQKSIKLILSELAQAIIKTKDQMFVQVSKEASSKGMSIEEREKIVEGAIAEEGEDDE